MDVLGTEDIQGPQKQKSSFQIADTQVPFDLMQGGGGRHCFWVSERAFLPFSEITFLSFARDLSGHSRLSVCIYMCLCHTEKLRK